MITEQYEQNYKEERTMKKLIALLLALILVCSFAACKNDAPVADPAVDAAPEVQGDAEETLDAEESEEERENIEQIETLYEVICDFAKTNYLTPVEVEFGNYFPIKHNDNYFYVGADCGQGASFYCTRLVEPEEDVLDYNEVVHNTKMPETIQKERRLEELSRIIDSLFNDDKLPIEVIENKTNEAFQKIKEQ